MADLQPQVPQGIEHRLDHLLCPSGGLPRRDEGDVDIAVRRHLPAAIAAHRHQGDALAGAAIAGRVKMMRRRVVKQAEDLVDEEGEGGHRLAPTRRLCFQPPRDVQAPGIERRLQFPDDQATQLCRITPVLARQIVDAVGNSAPIDDGAAGAEGGVLHDHRLNLISAAGGGQLFQLIKLLQCLTRRKSVGIDQVERGAQGIDLLFLLRGGSGEEGKVAEARCNAPGLGTTRFKPVQYILGALEHRWRQACEPGDRKAIAAIGWARRDLM